MIRKRYGKDLAPSELIRRLAEVLQALDSYFKATFDDVAKFSARTQTASEWWSGVYGSEFPILAYYATRVHASPCVSSSLERYFSMMTNTQTAIRSSLDAEKAGAFTAAHFEMVSAQQRDNLSKAQEGVVAFVEKMQQILESENIADIDEAGMGDLET